MYWIENTKTGSKLAWEDTYVEARATQEDYWIKGIDTYIREEL